MTERTECQKTVEVNLTQIYENFATLKKEGFILEVGCDLGRNHYSLTIKGYQVRTL
ncbi:MAG: hypothetical protein ACRCS6_04965 [Turicibacter sp.]